MAIKEITPQEAYDLLAREEGVLYIDVRTETEFSAGHPDGAVNIPVALSDPAQGMALNPAFVRVIQVHYPKDTKIIVGCQAGPRSETAARLLQEAGYQEIINMRGGFGGLRDASGQVIAPGWAGLGLPSSQANGEGVSYASLAAKTS
ncbi:MAG: rhodanese-like domain-containing protein [bacterium]|nr:rhodanese-like domain-containing protein [bacterium]